MSIGELQASVAALKSQKHSLEALHTRRRQTMELMQRKAENLRLRSVPSSLLEAVAGAKLMLETAERNLADKKWYVNKRYKYDSLAEGNDGGTADESGVTRYEQDKRIIEWAKAVREEATLCTGPEKVLLEIHALELEDQVANKRCARKRAQSVEKIDQYRSLELAVESAQEAHRQAEARLTDYRQQGVVMLQNAALARELFEQTDLQYSEIPGEYQEKLTLLMQKQREVASARRDARLGKLLTP